jgi:Asp-tRNA(Asn)/Glu-tRNA(Gln) amidotransferase B subunit
MRVRIYEFLLSWKDGDKFLEDRTPKTGKEEFIKQGMKYVMKVSKGQTNPAIVGDILSEEYNSWGY